MKALEKLCKWRAVLAGWHKGSAAADAPGCQANRDLMEKMLIYRVEITALVTLLVKKGVLTQEEFDAQREKEAALLDKDYERFFPGFRTSEAGIDIYDADMAYATTKARGFPP